MSNKQNSSETSSFETLEACLETLATNKYQNNLLLFVANLKAAKLPLAIVACFKTFNELEYHVPDPDSGKVKKRNKAEFL